MVAVVGAPGPHIGERAVVPHRVAVGDRGADVALQADDAEQAPGAVKRDGDAVVPDILQVGDEAVGLVGGDVGAVPAADQGAVFIVDTYQVGKNGDIPGPQGNAGPQGLESPAAGKVGGGVAENREMGVLARQCLAQSPGVKQTVGAAGGQAVEVRRVRRLERRPISQRTVAAVAQSVEQQQHAF